MDIETSKKGQEKVSNLEILNIIKKGKIMSANEIWGKVGRTRISLPGLMKKLSILMRSGNIDHFDLDKLSFSKKYKKHIFQTLGISKPDGRINRYYCYFPERNKLKYKLDKIIPEGIGNKRYKRLVENILSDFSHLEIMSIKVVKSWDDDEYQRKEMKKIIKKYGAEIGKKRVYQKDIDKFKNLIKNSLGELNEFHTNFGTKEKLMRVEGKQYMEIGDELIPSIKIIEFLRLIEIPIGIKWILHSNYSNQPEGIEFQQMWGERTGRIFENMEKLYIELVKGTEIRA
jgi:Tfp pilus assembly protein PilZ